VRVTNHACDLSHDGAEHSYPKSIPVKRFELQFRLQESVAIGSNSLTNIWFCGKLQWVKFSVWVVFKISLSLTVLNGRAYRKSSIRRKKKPVLGSIVLKLVRFLTKWFLRDSIWSVLKFLVFLMAKWLLFGIPLGQKQGNSWSVWYGYPWYPTFGFGRNMTVFSDFSSCIFFLWPLISG